MQNTSGSLHATLEATGKLKQCTEALKKLKKRIMDEVGLFSELNSLHTFGSNKRQRATDVYVWMDRVYLLETLLFSPWWLIYQPLGLKIGSTFLGSTEDIQKAIAACKKHRLAVIADVIINNLAAEGGEKESWMLSDCRLVTVKRESQESQESQERQESKRAN